MKLKELLNKEFELKEKIKEIDEKKNAIMKKNGLWFECPELEQLNEERGAYEDELYDIFLELEEYI